MTSENKLSEILLKKKDDLLKFVSSSDCFSGTSSRKSMKRSKLEELDTAVYKWFQQQRAEGNPISGPLLCEKAVWFHKKMQLEEPFSASQGWLSRFKARHGIRQLEIHGEKLSASKDAAELFKSEFLRIVRRHDLSKSQIYNADETGLFWKALPTKTLADGSEQSAPGYKMSKACANASGDHKLKLVCIGKSKKPRSFKGSNMKIFPVAYYSQKKAWMNQDIFKKWFFDEFVSENHTLRASSFLNVMKNVDVFKNVDESNVEEWLASDAQQLGYEIQDDDSIIEEVLTEGVCDAQNVLDSDDEQTVSKISPSEALHCTDQLLQFLEQEDDTNYADIVAIRKIRTQIRTKMCKKTSQLLITDFFKS